MLRWVRGMTRKVHVRNQVIQEYTKVYCMQNVNIRETEKIQLVWPHQNKVIRKPLKKSDGHSCTGEDKKGRGLDGDGSTTPGKIWI